MFTNPIKKDNAKPFKVDHTEPQASDFLAKAIEQHIQQHAATHGEIVIACIGTDRSTGDALGPLIGSKLNNMGLKNAKVYGTLDDAMHAVNLKDKLEEINNNYDNPLIIGVDACLGQLSSVGLITVANGPIKPGAGVNKVLPEVGAFHITGIVNVGGFMEFFVLQNTRLSLVMRMADKIADAIKKAVDGTPTR